MPQVLAMARCQWKWTESRKARAKASSKAKAVDPLAVNGPMDGCLNVDEAEDAPTKAKERENRKESLKFKGKKGGTRGGGNAKGKKGRGKVSYGQCANCHEYGHWAKDCPNMVNQVERQNPVPPGAGQQATTTPAAKTATTVRRIFQFESPSPSSSPSSPTSPISFSNSQVRMVLFHDADVEVSNKSIKPMSTQMMRRELCRTVRVEHFEPLARNVLN